MNDVIRPQPGHFVARQVPHKVAQVVKDEGKPERRDPRRRNDVEIDSVSFSEAVVSGPGPLDVQDAFDELIQSAERRAIDRIANTILPRRFTQQDGLEGHADEEKWTRETNPVLSHHLFSPSLRHVCKRENDLPEYARLDVLIQEDHSPERTAARIPQRQDQKKQHHSLFRVKNT